MPRRLTLALVAALCGLLGGLSPGQPAAAAQPAAPAPVSVQISTVSPPAPQAGESVVLRGQVRNRGDSAVTSTQVLLRLSRDRLEERADVQRVADDPDYRRGIRYEIAAHLPTTTLAAGATLPFRLEVSLAELGLTEPGVYVAGVEVRGVRADGVTRILAADRTFVPWLVDGERQVPVALLWPVVARPSTLPDGAQVDDLIERQLQRDGELRGLVEAGAARPGPLTWVLDPALLTTLAGMADGYDVRASGVSPPATDGRADGSAPGTVAGTAAPAAADVLATLRRTGRDGSERVILPFGDPDVTALSRRGRPGVEVAADAVTRGRAVGGPAPVVGWPYLGSLDERALGLLAPLARWVLAADTETAQSGADSDAAGSPVLRRDGAVLVRVDDALRAAYLDAGRPASSVSAATHLRQRLLAETALAALGQPDPPTPPTSLVLAPPRAWRPSAAMARAVLAAWSDSPWIRPISLADLVAAGSAPDARDTVVVDRARTALSPRQQRAARSLGRAVKAMHDLTEDDPPALQPYADAALSAWAATWRLDSAAFAAFTGASRAQAARALGQVRVIAPEHITLSGDSGRFPLTVSNGLPVPVTVRVDARSANNNRLQVTNAPKLRVAAGQKATVLVQARAVANGSVPVAVRLRTPQGQAFGPARTFTVQVTDYGRVGWIVIAVAGTILVVAAVRRILLRARGPRWQVRR